MNAISVQNVTKEYHRAGTPFHAVDAVSFYVGKGEMVGVVGRSGSGKSTLLNLVAGLLRPTSGSVVVDGVDIGGLSDEKMCLLRNRRIGYLPQGHSLIANLTVFDNVRLPHFFAPRDRNVDGRTEFLLDELAIGHLAKSYPAHLSGGEMRRVAIARAMMNSPTILLADEPTGDLDMENILAVLDIFASLANKGVAILYSTHEEEAVERADRVLQMASGRLTERMAAEMSHVG
ncbi:MAG: ABC transporter ATP-binding protein [Planctomycetes bacterium]|nr:ABC transporter ATP-binding protein [Planctomycetota bacterium]